MSERVTISNLRAVCERINRETGSPLKPWAERVDGTTKANVGNYHISQCYGGYALHRMMNEGGGVMEPFGVGHVPARDLRDAMFAYLRGIETGRKLAAKVGS